MSIKSTRYVEREEAISIAFKKGRSKSKEELDRMSNEDLGIYLDNFYTFDNFIVQGEEPEFTSDVSVKETLQDLYEYVKDLEDRCSDSGSWQSDDLSRLVEKAERALGIR